MTRIQLDARAAADFYCERTVTTFLKKVKAGLYPAPTFNRRGTRPMWHVRVLERHADAMHGVTASSSESIADLI